MSRVENFITLLAWSGAVCGLLSTAVFGWTLHWLLNTPAGGEHQWEGLISGTNPIRSTMRTAVLCAVVAFLSVLWLLA